MCNVVRLLCSSTGFCFLLGSAGAFAQDDRFDFKGAKLGISQQEFVEKVNFLKCDSPKRTPLSDVACYGNYYYVCTDYGKPSYAACTKEAGENYRFAGQLVESISANFYVDALSAVLISLSSGRFNAVVAALTEKYGKPSSVKTEAIQTKVGATYQNITMTWRRSDSSIVAMKFGGDINTSQIHYSLNSYDNEYKKRKEEESRKNANDL